MENEEGSKIMSCFCQGLCPYGMEYGTCQTKPGGKCFTSVELDIGDDGKEHPVLSYGCMPPNEMALFQCRSTLIASRDGKNIKCCDEYDFCNKHLLPIVEKPAIEQIDDLHITTLKVLLSSFAVCILIFLAGVYLIFLKFKKDLQDKNVGFKKDDLPEVEISVATGDDNRSIGEDSGIRIAAELSDSLGDSSEITSELVQRTISKQIKLEAMIAKGKYSEIWKAKWRGEAVAVKVYSCQKEPKWINETQIFQTPLIRHEHILGYIAADIRGSKPSGKLFLITEYYPQGTLRGFLQNHTLMTIDIFHILKGLAGALNHLHTEIIGRSKKPSITHNNINSKNILVKSDRTCCFANFAKATSFSSDRGLSITDDCLNDDIRYLAPEFLQKPYPTLSENYKMGDIYSFSLIMWEILNKYEKIPKSEYKLPYEDVMTNNKITLIEQVAIKKVRPGIKPEWSEDPFLKMTLKIMIESWNHIPSARLTSLRIKKTFFKIQEDIFRRPVDLDQSISASVEN